MRRFFDLVYPDDVFVDVERGRLISYELPEVVERTNKQRELTGFIVWLLVAIVVPVLLFSVAAIGSIGDIGTVVPCVVFVIAFLALVLLFALQLMKHRRYRGSRVYENGVEIDSLDSEPIFVPWGRFKSWEPSATTTSQDMALGLSKINEISAIDFDPEYSQVDEARIEQARAVQRAVEEEARRKRPSLLLRGNGFMWHKIDSSVPNYDYVWWLVANRTGDRRYDAECFHKALRSRYWVLLAGSFITSFILAFAALVFLGMALRTISTTSDTSASLLLVGLSAPCFIMMLILFTYRSWGQPKGLQPYLAPLGPLSILTAVYVGGSFINGHGIELIPYFTGSALVLLAILYHRIATIIKADGGTIVWFHQ